MSDINDHHLLCEAILLNTTHNIEVNFITSDICLYLFAEHFKELNPIFYSNKANENNYDDSYSGWSKYYPTEEQFALLYSNPEMNILNAKTNEFAEIYEGSNLRDVLFWTGKNYRPLKYKEFVSVLGERIKPRNLEQKMYLDLLQNQDIPVKLCIAKFGTGKSYLALSYALNALQCGRFDKIIFIKNNLEVKGAGKLGTLPGDEIAKQMPWLRQIEDHIGIQKFEEYLDDGRIEPAHLTSIRGRDLKNACIIVDEAENLFASNIQLILSRVASGSEVIFCADVKQCDYKEETMSGIPKMIRCLAGEDKFGMVRLLKTERSQVAAMADLLD